MVEKNIVRNYPFPKYIPYPIAIPFPLINCELPLNPAVRPKTEARKDGEIDPKFWEILLSADKEDYERICAEYGVTDFR